MVIYSISVTYNGKQWYDRCFNSLRNSNLPVQTIVIDNASTDDTIDYIAENYPEIHLIASKENLGFTKANNIGIKYALDKGADYIFLLNQDAWIENDTLEKLLNVFKDEPDAGIVSPVHLNGSGSELDLGFAGYIAPSNTPGFISDLYCGKLKKNYKTEFVNAAAWLISRKCIEKVGGFDASLFYHYGEDGNYCKRVIYNNFSIYINTETVIYHDRESRNEKRPEKFEQYREIVSRYVYYSNPFLDDEIISNKIQSLKTKYKRKRIKLILLLDFKNLRKFKEYTNRELEFFSSINKSRTVYKTGEINWLDKNPF